MSYTEYDAIVAGTGPGGATVARELTRRGKRVLILEYGSAAPVKGSVLQTLLWLGWPGKGLFITDKLLTLVRGVTLGGSTVFFYETAFDPPFHLLEKYGVNIRDEAAEVKRELPIGPLKDDLFGPMARRIQESALDLGYDWQRLPKYLYQDKCRPNCRLCEYGCPHGAKWNARMFVHEAVDGASDLIAGARVTRVLRNGRRAEGVEYVKWGMRYKVYAPQVIISAGGIGTPTILRRSGIKNAGYDFFFDPLIAVMGAVPDIRGGREIPMSAGLLMHDEGYMITDMTVPLELFGILAGQMARIDQITKHSRMLTIMIKAKDDLGGHITDEGGVRKPLTQADRNKMLRGYVRAKGILENAGARTVFKSWYLASHPGGTAKIGEVVDQNLKTELDNLYVCDCSVIPESWGLPPTYTLISLGKRLARHLE